LGKALPRVNLLAISGLLLGWWCHFPLDKLYLCPEKMESRTCDGCSHFFAGSEDVSKSKRVRRRREEIVSLSESLERVQVVVHLDHDHWDGREHSFRFVKLREIDHTRKLKSEI